MLEGAHELMAALSPGEIRVFGPVFGEKVRGRLHGRGRRVARLVALQLFDVVV